MPIEKRATCAECGRGFTPMTNRSRFRESACKTKFNNRRNQRGAAMYDLIMSKRFDRQHESEARSLIDNLARAARDADKVLRDGRPSWLPFEDAKAAIPLAFGSSGDQR